MNWRLGIQETVRTECCPYEDFPGTQANPLCIELSSSMCATQATTDCTRILVDILFTKA